MEIRHASPLIFLQKISHVILVKIRAPGGEVGMNLGIFVIRFAIVFYSRGFTLEICSQVFNMMDRISGLH